MLATSSGGSELLRYGAATGALLGTTPLPAATDRHTLGIDGNRILYQTTAGDVRVPDRPRPQPRARHRPAPHAPDRPRRRALDHRWACWTVAHGGPPSAFRGIELAASRDLTLRPRGGVLTPMGRHGHSTRHRQALDWRRCSRRLDEDGFVQTPPVLTAAERADLAGSFDDGRFRATIDMRRHRFGEGTYRYFDRPLPGVIDAARHALYPPLAELANRWAQRLGEPEAYPADLDGVPRALPPCRAGAADAAHPALHRGRPQRAPPGRLRRGRLPAAGGRRS